MTKTIQWYQSLNFTGIFVLLFILFWLGLGIVLILDTKGKELVAQESERLVEQTGNNAVADLSTRSKEIEALAKTIALTTEQLPSSTRVVMKILPHLLDFDTDTDIAGGGFWPEPYQFHKDRQRDSFFWGREADQSMKYYDDYNKPGYGYHNEEWYVPARYNTKGGCMWSKSYMDPYSYQPMVTCTVATFNKQQQFSGTVTIDLKLEGLHDFAARWKNKTGGYLFIVDRNNKFITFPQPDFAKIIEKDDIGNTTQEFMLAEDMAEKQPKFAPIAHALTAMNQEIIEQGKNHNPTNFTAMAKKINYESYQINQKEANLIAAMLVDPLKNLADNQETASNLYRKVSVESDFLLEQAATAFIFHVPDSYWKLVVVKPIEETTAVASQIVDYLLIYMLITAVIVIVVAYFVIRHFFIKPLMTTAKSVQTMIQLVSDKKFHDLELAIVDEKHISHNEIGFLAHSSNILANQIMDHDSKLLELNENLEIKVEERTRELSQALSELKASQAQLVQSEKMASLGQMVAGIVHEINTPIAFVQSNIGIVQENLDDITRLVSEAESLLATIQNPEAGEEKLLESLNRMQTILDDLKEYQVIEESTNLLEEGKTGISDISEMIQNLKNFSRMDKAKIAHTNLNQGLDSVLNIAKNQIKNKVEVIKEYGDIPDITCSPSQINQVFLNLVVNAAQAIEEKGVIRLNTRQEGNNVVVVIEDNGHGIPDDIVPKIFDPFFTTKKVGQGTGLGLSIVHTIIEDHGGHIQCQSEVGKGTRFTISLPIEQPQESADN